MNVTPPTIHPWSVESIGAFLANDTILSNLTLTVGAAWPAANLAIYIPFRILTPATATTMFVTHNGGNQIDVGIYDAELNRRVSSGSVAPVVVDFLAVVDIADTVLEPGVYYMALALDNNVRSVRRFQPVVGQIYGGAGCAQQAAAFPLPAVATPVTFTQRYIPVFGILFAPRTVV
jgi:hypothetical protein